MNYYTVLLVTPLDSPTICMGDDFVVPKPCLFYNETDAVDYGKRMKEDFPDCDYQVFTMYPTPTM